MTRTESPTKRMRGDESGDVAVERVGLARSPDAQATIDPKRASNAWISGDPDGVDGRASGPPAGDDRRQRITERRGRVGR